MATGSLLPVLIPSVPFSLGSSLEYHLPTQTICSIGLPGDGAVKLLGPCFKNLKGQQFAGLWGGGVERERCGMIEASVGAVNNLGIA